MKHSTGKGDAPRSSIRVSKNPNQAGKGDKYRPVDRDKWNENYDRIFGKKRKEDLKDE